MLSPPEMMVGPRGIYAVSAAGRADLASADGNVARTGVDAAVAAACLDCAVADGNVAAVGGDAIAAADGRVAGGPSLRRIRSWQRPPRRLCRTYRRWPLRYVSAPCDAPALMPKLPPVALTVLFPLISTLPPALCRSCRRWAHRRRRPYHSKAAHGDVPSGVDAIAVAAAARGRCAVGK